MLRVPLGSLAVVRAVLEASGAEAVARVCIDGGQTTCRFLAEGLVRRVIVTLTPVLPGQGRPLWGHGEGDRDLTLLGSRHRDSGFVQADCRA